MARNLDSFDDIVVRDVQNRHQYQSASSGNIIQHLYSHVSGNTANISVAEIVSADGLNQGQWDLLVSSSARRLVANTITTANAASLTANAAISVRAGNIIFRSANVNVAGNLTVTRDLTANVGRFNSCILDGPVTGAGVTSVVTSGSTALVTSGGVFTALENVSGGGLTTAPDQPTIRSVGTLSSLNVAGSMVVGGGTLRVETSAVRIGQIYDGLWASGTTPSVDEKTWSGVASGNGVFVAVGGGGIGNRSMRSSDGITWTSGPSSADNAWSSVAYGNGVFVAVASGGSNRVMTSSTNGASWIGRAALGNNWMGVAFGTGVFVAVANTGTGNRVMRSVNDGQNWTAVATPADNLWNSVTYGNGLFVAVSSDGVGNRVMTSPTGETWTLQTSAADIAWDSVTYGNGLFVAVANTGTGSRVMTSPNGETWALRTTPGTNAWTSVTYGDGLFVAVSATGVMTSPDGITWTAGPSASDNAWNSVTYGYGLFVAVASTGVQNRAMYAKAPILADLEVTDTTTISGNVSVGGYLSVGNTLSVGQVAGPRINLSGNSILYYSSNGAVDASMTTIGATENAGDGTGELVLTGRDYTYAGNTFNNGSNVSTGVVKIQAYPLYPVITDPAQSIRQYALAQRFWSGKVPRNTASPGQTLQFWGNGNYGLYGTYSVQYMTKSGTFHNAVGMCMRGTAASPGNTNALTWQTLSSSTSNTSGLSITFGVVSNWVPQITFSNTTGVNAWFHVSAVVFDESVIHDEAAS